MIETPVVYHEPRRKTKRFTRKQLHKLHQAERDEKKAAERQGYKAQARAARTEGHATAVFEGTDPARTLALIGEEN